MTGTEVERRIRDWLNRYFPSGPEWFDPEFNCLAGAPLEVRMISVFDALEYNVSNGGWSQVLWNCFGRWRDVLNISEQGYLLMGEPGAARAVCTMRPLLEANEPKCIEFLHRAILERGSDKGTAFADFTMRSYAGGEFEGEPLLQDSQLYERRMAWLEKHQQHVLLLLEHGP